MSSETSWKVQPHGPVVMLAENLWTVEGTIQMPPGPLSRRMTIVRLENRSLVVFSAIAVDEPTMRDIQALGDPAFLVVPNPFHRLDAPGWKDRFPQMRVVAPPGARVEVEKLLPVDDVDGAFGDPKVKFVTVAGTDRSESALIVETADGTTLILNDLIGNIQDARGLMKFVLTAMGFAGRTPQVPRMYKLQAIKDSAAVGRQLQEWSMLPRLNRVLVSHGAIIDDQPGRELAEIAKRMI